MDASSGQCVPQPPSSHEPCHIVVVYTDAGGGHFATALAIKGILEADGDYRVTLVNPYRGVLANLDPFQRGVGCDVESIYNDIVLARGHTGAFCLGFFALSALSVALLRRAGSDAFLHLWHELKPDLVISVLPLLNPSMIDSLKAYRRGAVPFAIMMTDWAEVSRHVWFPRGADYAGISGTRDGVGRLQTKGHPAERTFAMGGLLVRPEFNNPLPDDLDAARAALGLEPTRPTVVISYGGHGGPRMVELADALAAAGSRLQVVFLCGRNDGLVQRLKAARLPFPHRVLGFRPDVQRFLAASDLFVGKAGPLSVSEALALGLPLLIDEKRVLPQEVALTRWVRTSGSGATFRRPDEFVRKVEALAATPRSVEAREAARCNTAHRDLVRIVGTLLKRGSQTSPGLQTEPRSAEAASERIS